MAKILLTIFRDERGGRQISLENTASVLEDLGFIAEVTALYGGTESGFRRPITRLFSGPEHEKSDLIVSAALADHVKTFDPDYIVNFSCPHVHDLGYPVIERVDVLYSYYERQLHQVFRESRNLTAVVGQTSSMAALLRGMLDQDSVPVHWIPNFVEATPPISCSRSRTRREFRVINIGRNHPVKNITAFLDVARECPDSTFVLVTNEAIQHLPENVELHVGIQEAEQDELLACADLYLSLSLKEGISNASLRAFVHGLPAILTDADGVCAHLKGNAWVIDTFSVMRENKRYPGTIRQIAASITQLRNDEGLRSRMANKSLRAVSFFSRDMVRYRWTRLIDDLGDRRRRETVSFSSPNCDDIESAAARHIIYGDTLEIGGARGQPYAPYVCPDTRGMRDKISVIFMSYGFERRCEVLLRSLELQEGIAEEAVEIVTFANHACTRSRRFSHQLIRFDESIHKAAMLNRGVALATGTLLVFTDADALLPPYFLAHVQSIVQSQKLFTAARKNLAPHIAEIIVNDPSIIARLNYQGLREALPDRWSLDWLAHTPSGFMHVLRRELFERAGRYDEACFTQFDGYDWEFNARVAKLVGQPVLAPDLWAIHLDHTRDYSGDQIRMGRVKL